MGGARIRVRDMASKEKAASDIVDALFRIEHKQGANP